ncbi:MAG: MBL fold metallo-hydrolase [Thermodesulfovibrio sp.]|nr:MBL fold metallo-hydrolase [Thermodesulfovibrio sp.]
MIVKVLGSSGAEFPGFNPPAFLIDGTLLLDAGTIGAKLSAREQSAIKHILITHSHLDHIKGIPFLADNIIITRASHSVTLYGVRETLDSLKKNLLNDKIWPDFTKISASIDPVLKLRPITPSKMFRVGDYAIRGYRVNHTVPAVGYIVRDSKGKTLLYTGDTGPTEEIWKARGRLDAIIIEVSFPDAMEELARKTGHMTPAMLVAELTKLKGFSGRVFITHPKPQYIKQIRKEIARLGMQQIELLQDGKSYRI